MENRRAMAFPHRHLTIQPIDFWLARGAILVIVGLQIGIVNDLAVGPRWLAPCLELALLIPLSIATAWTQKRARKVSTNAQWKLVGRDRRMVRLLAIILTAVGGYYGGGYYGSPYAYGGGCYIQRQAFINRFGHRVIRRVRVCD
jgi:hypothetical protein